MAVTKEQLPEFIRKTLGPEYLKKSGGIFYSSHETLCAGDVYLIGLNPGGEGGSVTLDQCLDRNMTQTDNALLDADWGSGIGQHPIQKHARWLLEKLGLEPRKVFATNLIFVQSPNQDGVSKADANTCWQVHEAFLSIVRPRLILAFGNNERLSPYSYMRETYNGKESPPVLAGYSSNSDTDWELKGFKATIAGCENVFVAGLPHLRYYDPCESGKSDDNQPVINWIKSHWTNKNQPA